MPKMRKPRTQSWGVYEAISLGWLNLKGFPSLKLSSLFGPTLASGISVELNARNGDL